MGKSVKAGCSSCGYSAQVEIGRTRRTFTTVDMFPAICFNCRGRIAHVNRIQDPHFCYRCKGTDVIPYGDLTRLQSDEAVYSEDDHGKLSGDHACPACQSYSLVFEVARGRFID